MHSILPDAISLLTLVSQRPTSLCPMRGNDWFAVSSSLVNIGILKNIVEDLKQESPTKLSDDNERTLYSYSIIPHNEQTNKRFIFDCR